MPQEPYIKQEPGNLITAEDWNDLQTKIQDDIDDRVEAAIEEINSVSNSDDAERLDGKTLDEIKKEILAESGEDGFPPCLDLGGPTPTQPQPTRPQMYRGVTLNACSTG